MLLNGIADECGAVAGLDPTSVRSELSWPSAKTRRLYFERLEDADPSNGRSWEGIIAGVRQSQPSPPASVLCHKDQRARTDDVDLQGVRKGFIVVLVVIERGHSKVKALETGTLVVGKGVP